MASPQLEDGFTQIANELLERLAAACLSAREMSIMLILARMCYSAKKKRKTSLPIDKISLFLEIDRSGVSRLLSKMEKKGLIIRLKPASGRQPAEFGIQKDWHFWRSNRTQTWPPLMDRFGNLVDPDQDPLGCNMSATQNSPNCNPTEGLGCNMSATQLISQCNLTIQKSRKLTCQARPPRDRDHGKRSPIEKTGGGYEVSLDHVPPEVIAEAKRQLFQITEIAPTTKDYFRVRAIARITPPGDWMPDDWKDHCLETVYDCLKAVASESRRGMAIGSVYAVACTRARQKLQTETLQGERP